MKHLKNLEQLGIRNVLTNKKFGDISTILQGNSNGEKLVDNILSKLQAEFMVMPLVCHEAKIASLHSRDHEISSYYNGRLYIIKNVDGLHYVTNKKVSIGLGITTADCPTVVLAKIHKGKTVEIVIMHVGRRPLVQGIIENGIKTLSKLPGKLFAGINPGISGKYYQLTNGNSMSTAMREFQRKYPRDEYPDVYPKPDRVDLKTAITHTLIEAEVQPAKISSLNTCSYKDKNQHSFRRDGYPPDNLKLDALFIRA